MLLKFTLNALWSMEHLGRFLLLLELHSPSTWQSFRSEVSAFSGAKLVEAAIFLATMTTSCLAFEGP